MKPPGHHYLVMDHPVMDDRGNPATTLAEKCEHNQGQWVVEWENRFFPFVHANQLQKDIWLGDADSPKNKEKRIELLRWYCSACGNCQRP